ncbi:MAG: hypothetical protein R2795_01380 [Saprospiraceae bacterium]
MNEEICTLLLDDFIVVARKALEVLEELDINATYIDQIKKGQAYLAYRTRQKDYSSERARLLIDKNKMEKLREIKKALTQRIR